MGAKEFPFRIQLKYYIVAGSYTEAQIGFVNQVIDWVAENGTLTPEDMKDEETFGGGDLFAIFDENIELLTRIRGRIESVNANAMRQAA